MTEAHDEFTKAVTEQGLGRRGKRSIGYEAPKNFAAIRMFELT
jgi:hypothetical protein